MPIFSNIKFDPLLRVGLVNNSKIRNWNSIQEEYAQKGRLIIEYESSGIDYIQLIESTLLNDKKDDLSNLNEGIDKYLSTNQNSDHSDFLKVSARMRKLGLIMPVSDIKEQASKDINAFVQICMQLIDNLPYSELINAVKDNTSTSISKGSSPWLLSLFFILENYVNTLVKYPHLKNNLQHLGGFKRFLIDPKSIESKTDSYQFISWMIELIECHFLEIRTDRIDSNKYSQITQSLILKYRSKILAQLKSLNKEPNQIFQLGTLSGLRQDINQLVENDRKLAVVQVLTAGYRNKYKNSFNRSKAFFDKLDQSTSFASRVKKMFSTKNVIETVQSFTAASFPIEEMSIYNQSKELISRFDNLEIGTNEINEFYDAFTNIDDDLQLLIKQKGKRIFDIHMCELTNTFCSPILKWTIKGTVPVFQLNLASTSQKYKSLKYYEDKKHHASQELRLLQEKIDKLTSLNTRSSIEQFYASIRPFFYRSNQVKWEMAYTNHLKAIQQRVAYRNRKMKELGIYSSKIDQSAKDIYLDEMLRIEEEVKRFVPFVTEAFKAALPSRKSTELDPHRRTYDGIEFDPETMMDAEKWIRGDVMKPLRVKIETGEVTQVNAFCLDLSGSMNHERMRNLYKILYLMVMGLESRKSYDAFHFFSNSFIPGVEFKFKHTTKELLFSILRRISSFTGTRIQYHGIEGTNISDGVKGCMISIKHFVTKLRQQHPNMNLSCSMFVITDGEPSLGITNLTKLNEFITDTAKENNVAIKGVYIKSHADLVSFIHTIFGEENSVETSSFEEGVTKLVSIMTRTYKKQRLEYKWTNKKAKVFGNTTSPKK